MDTQRCAKQLALISLMVGISGNLHAVVGCLDEQEKLVPRAKIIVIGTIERLGTAKLPPCPPSASLQEDLNRRYEKCGEVSSLEVVVKQHLKGDAPDHLVALVASEGWGAFPCDDRPPLEKMIGREGVLFMETSGDELWTIDGPNSILIGAGYSRVATIIRAEGMRITTETVQASAHSGETIDVIHKLSTSGGRTFHGCFGTDNRWVFEGVSRHSVRRDDYDPFRGPSCLQEFELKPGDAIEWRRSVLIPLDADRGDIQMRARVQILDGEGCADWQCGYTYLESESTVIKVTDP